MVMKIGSTLWVLLVAFVSHAASLTLDLDIRTRAVEIDPAYQHKSIAIFVLDRSGSMLWSPANGEKAKNRNQLLRESVRERIKTIGEIEPKTEIYFLSFSDTIRKIEGPCYVRNSLEVSKLLDWSGFEDKACHGQTLLYDAQAKALDLAEQLFQAHPGARIKMFVYSDGENETPSSGTFTDENLESGFFSSNRVKVRFPSKARCSETERAKAAQSFELAYAGKVKSYVKEKKIEQHWGWLGAGEPPRGIKATKDEYVVGLFSDAPVLKSPNSAVAQTLPISMVIPLPSRYSSDLNKLNATLSLDLSGRRVASKVISLRPGKKTVSFDLPSGLPKVAFVGKLYLSDIPDAWEKVSLRTPNPMEITFSAPDALSFLAVMPSSDAYIRVGDSLTFNAKASDDASVQWSFLGQDVGGGSFTHKFDQAGDYVASVRADKTGFVSARDSVKVHVIDTTVVVKCATAKPMVGDDVSFEAGAIGRVENISWWIDGQPVVGTGNTLGGQVFDRSGRHSVKVRAFFGHGITADSDDLLINVAAKPSVMITDPFGGSEFEFGEKIECKANVEGEFDKVVWKISGPITEEQETPVLKEGRVSKSAFFKPAKGGQYVLTATAVGSTGSLDAKTSVRFKVAKENLGVVVVSPASGTSVSLGPDAGGVELKAEIRGEAIKQIKWTALNKKTGKLSAIRTTPVQSRVASCAYSPDESIGNGVTLVIQAEAMLDGADEPIVSAPIELVSRYVAELAVEAKVDGQDANGREVKFGSQVELAATCKGGVKPDEVMWFAQGDGKERQIGTGPSCLSPKESPAGVNLRTVRYFARTRLADGSLLESRKVIVHHNCPDIRLAIKLPCGADGIARTQFGLNEHVSFGLTVSDGAELMDVQWDMGDGKLASGPVVNEFRYSAYGEYVISARGKCVVCGKEYSAEPVKVKVRVVPPKAAFDVVERGTYYTVGGKLHLRAQTGGEYGDITNFVWTVNGKRLADYEGKKDAIVSLPKHPCDLVLGLTVVGPKGTKPDTAEACEIRVRYGWWAAVPAVLILLLLLYVAFRLLLGNGPRKWEFYTWEGPAPRLVNGCYPDELGDAYLTKGVPLSGIAKWSYWNKKGRIRLSDMLMLDCADGNPWMPFAEDEFEIKDSNGTPIVRPPEGKFDDITGEVNLTGEAPYFLFRYVGVDYSDQICKGHDYLRLRVVNDANGGWLGVIAFLLIFGLLIWAFIWACMTFAV